MFSYMKSRAGRHNFHTRHELGEGRIEKNQTRDGPQCVSMYRELVRKFLDLWQMPHKKFSNLLCSYLVCLSSSEPAVNYNMAFIRYFLPNI